jgi:hypothetical protein
MIPSVILKRNAWENDVLEDAVIDEKTVANAVSGHEVDSLLESMTGVAHPDLSSFKLHDAAALP